MKSGFLGYDASFMLDFVVTALVLIVPALLFSIYQVKYRKEYKLHRSMQVALGLILLVAVVAFEVDTQLIHGGWQNIVNKDASAPRLDEEALIFVRKVLWVHLIFAVTTPFLWATTIILALKRFSDPPIPGPHSRLHKKLAWASTIDITMTSVTGLIFYYFAFMAG
ncbi:hypothetical protein Pla110_44760 [Polystyrenella longa]|uniref:DUF420 domain-containing protein n=1 Tax=Polystyrenella longa TaxID=2528007 RepID=A0A518CU52_9PLAN|nr:DUF420 domain-containing protein [Polystyrenella longa]QDU82714.1 hypothetical protein Pla110_44760 [Polystyrenella longa]